MKRIIKSFFLISFLLLLILILILSTLGIETNKFNKLISDKALQTNNIDLELETIKFKIDLKEVSLFLQTQNPKIIYREIYLPVQNVKVYIDFLSLIKSNPRIIKTSVIVKELAVNDLKKLSKIIKPSNFKSILNNKIKEGKIASQIDIFLNDQGSVKDFIAKGSVSNFKAELLNNLNLEKISFSFFGDKKDVLIKNINGNISDAQISDGDIKIDLENGIKLKSNFNSTIEFNEKVFEKYSQFVSKFYNGYKIKNLKSSLNNNLFIHLDKTYKVKDYNYNILGKLEQGHIELAKPIKNNFSEKEIKEFFFSNLDIQGSFDSNGINLKGNGKYSTDNSKYLKINFDNNFRDNFTNLKFDLEYEDSFELKLINHKKVKGSIANLAFDIEKKGDNLKIKNLDYNEGKKFIKIKNLLIKKNKFFSFKKIEVDTINNNFYVQNGKKILIKGTKFDATNLAKILSKKTKENNFINLNSKIEIDFKDIKVPMSETLQNFKLLGEIKKGQFFKITSKGDFGGNNFLDISMKKDKNSDKKYLEIYSDLTRPLLTEYSFFKGLSGGKLLFNSIIDGSKSYSKLKIEDFKMVNAPDVIKLLSLADLGGLADLAKGEGLSFDILEINMEKNNNFLKLNEILALGPSMSVLMEGYQDENGLTSLRGTIVPAKTLNKMISKIPVIGNIVIPKEIGEGLFGISFKMKGPKGNIKTTINPIKTLTPRFIQKIVERNKEIK